jgi:hypothetical protein
MISELQFSVASVSAVFCGVDIEKFKDNFYPEYPIVRIKCKSFDRQIEDHIVPAVKSGRGRKKKNTRVVKKFKSNVSFIVKWSLEPEGITKLYNIRIFNGGKIVCVGILRQDKSDFYYCIQVVREYVARRLILHYAFLDIPSDVIYPHLIRKIEVRNVKSTLENYQFSMGKNINLYLLKEFLINISRDKIININYEALYEYFTEAVNAETFELNIDQFIRGITLKGSVRVNFVNAEKLRQELFSLKIETIAQQFATYWNLFIERHKNKLSEFFTKSLKYNMLKQFVRFYFEPIKIICDEQDDLVVDSVIFKETKNTLMVKKKIVDTDINFRIFGTGIVNIQGGNSYEISSAARIKICSIISEKFLYDPNKPPMRSWKTLLEPLSIHGETNHNIY